jgi:hypothetical protein
MDGDMKARIRGAGHSVGQVTAAIEQGRVLIQTLVELDDVEDIKDYLNEIFKTAGKIKHS